MRSVAPLALALSACTASTATTGDVSWSGYVFADPYVSEDLLTGGAFEVLTPDGGCLEGGDGGCIVGEESSSTAGYWGVSVPVTTPVALRLSGDGLAPTATADAKQYCTYRPSADKTTCGPSGKTRTCE